MKPGVGLLAALLISVSGTGAADLGRQVGMKHAAYALSLAADGQEFGSAEQAWLSEYEDKECSGPPVEPGRQHQLSKFIDLFCTPWKQLMDSLLDTCDGDEPPSWCADHDDSALYDHLRLDDYFGALQSALADASVRLERYNLIHVMVNVLDAHFAAELPAGRLERSYVRAVTTYLATAEPADVIALGRHFQQTWIGVPRPIALRFAAYAKRRKDLSPEQRTAILDFSTRRFAE